MSGMNINQNGAGSRKKNPSEPEPAQMWTTPKPWSWVRILHCTLNHNHLRGDRVDGLIWNMEYFYLDGKISIFLFYKTFFNKLDLLNFPDRPHGRWHDHSPPRHRRTSPPPLLLQNTLYCYSSTPASAGQRKLLRVSFFSRSQSGKVLVSF